MKRHPFDSFSFITGVITVATGSAFLFGPDNGTMGLGWIAPVWLLGLGAGVVAAGVQKALRKA